MIISIIIVANGLLVKMDHEIEKLFFFACIFLAMGISLNKSF